MNYLEFSRNIKQKYPQYNDIDDRELAQKMVSKYPQYSDVTFESLEEKSPSILSQSPRVLWESAGELAPMAQKGLEAISESLPEVGTTKSTPMNVAIGMPRLGMETLSEVAPSFLSRGAMIGSAVAPAVGPALKTIKPILKPVGKYLGRVSSEVAGKLTGVQPEEISRLYKQPSSLLQFTKGKSAELYRKAQKGVEKLSVDEAFEAATKTAKRILKNAETGQITPIQALEGRQNIDAVIESTRSDLKIQKLIEQRKKLDEIVKSDPTLAKADAIYSKYILGSKFRKLLPVTKKGEISLTKSTVIPMFATLAHQPYLAALGSPATTGIVTSGLGATSKLAQAAMPFVKSSGLMGTAGAVSSMVLDKIKAKEYLKKANGDKKLARQMAISDGFTIPKREGKK